MLIAYFCLKFWQYLPFSQGKKIPVFSAIDRLIVEVNFFFLILAKKGRAFFFKLKVV